MYYSVIRQKSKWIAIATLEITGGNSCLSTAEKVFRHCGISGETRWQDVATQKNFAGSIEGCKVIHCTDQQADKICDIMLARDYKRMGKSFQDIQGYAGLDLITEQEYNAA